MKKLILVSTLILCFSVLIFAQTENLPCPKITVQGPLGVTEAGGAMSFTAFVENEKQNLEYEWTVEPETDFEGQGTSKIKVMTKPDLAGANITATVKIKGLAENCNNTASDLSPIAPRCELTEEQVGLYGYNFTDSTDDKAVIDGLWLQFTNSGRSGANYILFEIENDKQLQEVKERISFINNFFEYRGYDPKKFLLEVCKTGVYYTTALHISKGKEFPRPENCKLIDIEMK